MKLLVPLTALTLLLFLPTAWPAAPSYHVEIKCELKRLDVKRNASESTEKTEESWAYRVTISNHSFKAIPDLRVEYLVFTSRQRFGSTDGAKETKPTSGDKTLGTLENNAQTSFDTEPLILKKARLKADWVYTNGAKKTAQDAVTGIWVRAYSGAEMIAEFAQPSALKTQAKWER